MARPKLSEEEKERRKRERKLQKELFEKQQYQKKLDAGYTPISEILKENEQEVEISDDKNLNRNEESNLVKNFFAGLGSGLATVPSGLVALGEAVPRTAEALTRAAIDPNVNVKDALVNSLIENKSLELTGKIDDFVREKISGKSYEELNPNEQMASLGGELLPLFASGGSKGLVKVGDFVRKSALKAAKKEAVNAGKALSSQAIKNLSNKADLASNLLLPGVQITKNAPKAQQLAEVGIQTAIPLGMNELTRAGLEQEGIIGDYSKKDNDKVTLIKDKKRIGKKKFVEDLDEGVIQEYTIDNQQQDESAVSDTLKNTALFGAAVLGSAAGVRKLRSLFTKEIDQISKPVQDAENFYDSLPLSERLDTSIADRFAFRQKAVDEGLLKEETANTLAQDMHSKINSAFNTGKLSDEVQLSFSPQSTYDKLHALKLYRENDYKHIEDFLELNSLLQDEANTYNKFYGYTNLSTDDYIKSVLEGNITKDAENMLSSKGKIASIIKNRKNLLDVINSNPETKQILQEISDIGKGLLDVMDKSNMFSKTEMEYLKKNRTFDGLFLYKPRIADTNKTIKERLRNYLLTDTPYNEYGVADMSTRGKSSITKAKNYLDVFEQNFKQTLLDIHDNTVKRNALKQMAEGSFAKVSQKIDEYDTEIKNLGDALMDSFNTGKKVKITDIKKLTNDYIKQIDKLFTARPIGSYRISDNSIDIVKPKSLFDLLNKPKKENNGLYRLLDQNYSQDKGDITKNIKSYRESKDIISFMEDGVEHLYKVDPIIKAAFDLNTSMPSLLAESMKSLKNVVQTTITGSLNPLFSTTSAIMSTHEALTVLPKLVSKLKDVDGFSRIGYMKEIGKSFKDILTNDIVNNIVRAYDKAKIKTYGKMDTPMTALLDTVNTDWLRSNLKSSLLTQVKEAGGASAKPFNTNRGIYYTLNKNTKLSEKTEKVLAKLYGVNGATQVINIFNYLQQAIREAPSLALTNYLGKASGAIKENKIVDLNKMNKVIDTIGTYTANVGKKGSGKGFLGGTAKFVEDYVPYGNVMIKSLAPKVRASGLDKGITNIVQTAMDLYDPNVRYIDILNRIRKNGAELIKNKFVEGLMTISVVPSLISYVWNYGSQQNMNTYHSLSDYDKASKFILTNFFGKDKHLILPKDQEVALSDSIFTTLLDGILGMSRYNEVDPAFQQSKVILQSLARSIGIDSIPALDIVANLSGYDFNLNVIDDRPFITNLKQDNVNRDLSETAYQNGLVNQQTTQLINSILGIFGSTLLGSFEEANVGARNDTGLEDFGSTLFDRFTKSAQYITGNKAISSYNETSKEVYKKQALISKIASVKNKTPKQEEVYSLVRNYRRNRIKPIHDNVTELRNSINTVRANGLMSDGSVLDYEGRKAEITNMNKQLQRLFAREYKEYKNLDKLIEQTYGKDINLENFMEKFNGQ